MYALEWIYCPHCEVWAPNLVCVCVCVCVYVCVLSRVILFVTPRLLCPWNFPGKNIGVGYHILLQEISTEGLNPCLLHWQADSLSLSHQVSPIFLLAVGFQMKVSCQHLGLELDLKPSPVEMPWLFLLWLGNH